MSVPGLIWDQSSVFLAHLDGWAQAELAGIALVGFTCIRRLHPPAKKGTRGKAGWMTIWQAKTAGWQNKRGSLFAPLRPVSAYGVIRRRHPDQTPGLIIGDWSRWTLLPTYYKGDANVVTVGPPGTWKGVGVLIPNALRAKFMFLYDPGGEVTAVCIKEWRAQGYAVHIINPWGMFPGAPYSLPSSGFNPFRLIGVTSRTFSSDCLMMASMLVERSKNPDHWEKKGFGSIQKLIMHIMLEEPPEKQNLLTLRRLIQSSIPDWSKLIAAMQESSSEAVRGQGNEWARMFESTPKEFGGILSTMESATMWLDDEVVKDCVQELETRFADLKGYDESGNKLKGAIVAVIIPLEFKESHAPFVRLAIACMLVTMQRGQLALSKVLVMLDEYGSLGKMDSVIGALTTLRKYRALLHLVVHSIGQMAALDEEGWSRIEGACELRHYLATWDGKTAGHVSQACGTSTVEEEVDIGRVKLVARQLRLPEEVTQMRLNQQIAFFGNLPPALLRITPYWQRPELRGKFNDNPYHGKTPGLHFAWRGQLVLGCIIRMFSGYAGPLAVMGLLMLTAILYGWQ